MPHAITFGGGGSRIIGSFGVLTHLIDTGMTARVVDWYGCSAGAICALFGAIGVSSTWLREVSLIFDARLIGVIREDYVCDFTKVWGVSSTEGLGDIIGKFIETWEPGSASWTFADFAAVAPGVGLHISATNLTRGTSVLFDVSNSPTMKIIDAICASSTIPFFFTPWVHPGGDIYCDGGVMEHYPWAQVPNKSDTLVIVCADKDIGGRVSPPRQITSLLEYFSRIVSLAQHPSDSTVPRFWIAVNNRTINGFDFHITKGEILAAFEEGIRTAKGWMAYRASRLDSQQETAEIHSTSASRRISEAVRSSPGKMMDIRQSDNRTPHSDPPLDLHSGGRRSVRRWSL